ncbi:MAG: hypothetical protein IJX47_09830 [Clostridia bacterium]|nr:hypothetical protein [Clostridia bacterium]
MNENEKIDADELLDEMEDRLREMIEDAVSEALDDQLESVVTCAVQDAIEDLLSPKRYTYVLSPDKSKMLRCRGGLRVDGTCLMIQAGTTCWRDIAVYPGREEAIQALEKVKNAMLAHMEIIEL